MKYDAIIFDIDGTLWDARESITQAWNLAIGELTGTPGQLETETFGGLFGRPLDELIGYAFPGVEKDKRAELGAYCLRRENEELVLHPGTLYPGVRETLEQLAEQYPLYIVSNCGVGYIEAMLEGTGLRHLFRGWLCYADTNAPKDVTIQVLSQRCGLKNPVYVGDIQADADACGKAGVDIIWAAYGLGTIQRPRAAIRSFAELPKVVNNPYDSVIFDVDGTLWYACDKVAKIWSAAAEKYLGYPVNWTGVQLEKEFGKTMDDIMADLLPQLTLEQRQQLGQMCFDGENEGLALDPGVLYPGVAETVRELARRNRLFIVSNCQKGYIEVMLDAYGLRDCFQGWLCWEDTLAEKNETLRVLMQQYGLRHPVYVGDTQGDADSCAKAGIDMIFAAYGLGKVEQPQSVIQSFEELLERF